jgi:hypothetical protein
MPDGAGGADSSDRQDEVTLTGRRRGRPPAGVPPFTLAVGCRFGTAPLLGTALLLAVVLLAGALLCDARAAGSWARASTATALSVRATSSARPASSAPGAPVATAVSDLSGGRCAGPDAVLGRRAQALLRHDRAGWLVAVDPGTASLLAQQSAAFDRITALPVVRWHYRVTARSPRPAGGCVLRVEQTYRLMGDTRDVLRVRTVTVRPHGGGWLVESERPATDADRDLWDLAPPTVARGSRSVAVSLGAAPSAAGTLAARVDAAARAVDAVWGPGWPRTVVTILPADLAQMAAVLGRADPTGLDQLAAVTSGPLDRGRTGPHTVAGAADRVVLNPLAWDRLTDVGRQVVLAHELTHVATRASTSATPPAWLDEGLATYVGYRGSGLPDTEVAADALPDVRAGRLPAALPGADRFDPTRGDPAPAYAQAWTACDLVTQRAGIAGLVTVYRVAASAGGGDSRVDAALRQVLGENVDAFVARWRQRLRALAGAGG